MSQEKDVVRMVALDPSGNYGTKDGFGTTGVAYFEDGNLVDFKDVDSVEYESTESYWQAVWLAVENQNVIVCESYRLFNHKALSQSGSDMATCQLIGYLRMAAWFEGIKVHFQDPSIKSRFSDDVLRATNVVTTVGKMNYVMNRLTNMHIRDAIRHGMYYAKYGVK
jgi:hypothetical protein